MDIPSFGWAEESRQTVYYANFNHFYYAIQIVKSRGIGLLLENRPEKMPIYKPSSRRLFLSKLVLVTEKISKVRSTVLDTNGKFDFYSEHDRFHDQVYGLFNGRQNAFILYHNHEHEYPLQKIEKSLVLDQSFDDSHLSNISRRDIRKVDQVDRSFFLTSLSRFHVFLNALQIDLNRPSASFTKSKGLTDKEISKLTRLCKKHQIRFFPEAGRIDEKALKIGNLRFTQYDTALKTIEAIIIEKTFNYHPSYKPNSRTR